MNHAKKDSLIEAYKTKINLDTIDISTRPEEGVQRLADGIKRPNTSTTARDAALRFVDEIIQGKYGDQKDFTILFQTNNPYIERQGICAQREVNKVLLEKGLSAKGYIVKIEAVGFACKEDIATIHSEVGALVAEKSNNAVDNLSPEANTLIKNLLFQSRENIKINDQMPDTPSDISVISMQSWFDKILP